MSLRTRFLGLFRTDRLERELDDELGFHFELKVRDLVAAGMDEKEARREAALRVGNRTVLKERTRDMDVVPWLDNLARDVRFSVRGLARSRMYTVVAVLTLALGIGGNVAVFSVVESALLRPLPYPDPGRLLFLTTTDAKGREDFISYTDLLDWRAQSKTLEQSSAFTFQSVNLTGEREPERLSGGFVSADFFHLLGTRPAIGRLFQAADDGRGAAGVAVATYELWKDKFGGASDVIGRKLVLNNQPFTVVGVLPADFRFPWGKVDIWVAFHHYPPYRPGGRGSNAAGLARLRPGYTIEQAAAEMGAIAGRLAAQFPETNAGRTVRLRTFHEFLVRDTRPTLLLMWGAAGFVFLIACANIANLALARILSREREMGIRAALGAGRARLLRQVFVEQLVLALAGASLGLLVGHWGTRVLTSWQGDFALAQPAELNPAAAGFGFALAILAALACAVLPALHLVRRGVTLETGGRAVTEGRHRAAARRALVVAQIALALVLLAGAGLLLRSFANVNGIDPGFRAANKLTLEYRVPRNKYPATEQQWAFHWQVIQRIRRLPGVRSASAVLALPFSGNSGTTVFHPADRPAPPRGSETYALVNRAAPGLFETMGIPLLRGRSFDERDIASAPKVVVISQTCAQRHFAGRDPIGLQLRLPEMENTAATIVGVSGDIRHRHLLDDQRVQIWAPMAQFPHIFSTLVIETHGDPLAYANAVRRAVWSVDKDQPVWKVRTLESLVEGYLEWRGFFPKLVAALAAFALLLAGIGLYGVVAYATGRRTREFGLRMAVGARPRDVFRLVLAGSARMTALGVALGAAGALFLSGLLEKHLYGVATKDPLTFVCVAAVLAGVAALASVVPARRALRVDPVTALRHD